MKLRAFAVLFSATSLFAQTVETESRPFDVTGRVVTWDGRPIAGARFTLAAAAEIDIAELVRTEGPQTAADGTFTLHVPPAAKGEPLQMLFVAAKGHASRQVVLPGVAPVLGDPKKPRELGDLMLPPGQRMVGRVRDAAGQPVAGAMVVAGDLLPMLLPTGEDSNYRCSARTSKSGIFDLPGALPAGSYVVVHADGYYSERRRPVAAGAPLEFELQASGVIEGRVERAKGQGVAKAWVAVSYEETDDDQQLQTDASGAFRLTVRHPGRWRVRAWTDGDDPANAFSAAGSGPATGVRIEFAAKDAPGTPKHLTVRATKKGSTEAVRTFRAWSLWGQLASNPKPWLRQWLARLPATKAGPDGSAEIAGPRGDGEVGVVLVLADGFAPLLQTDVAFDENSKSLAVELEPEASVRGIVRDATTRQPLAGAIVTATAVGEEVFGFAPADGAAAELPRTAADGTFRLGQLGEGDWQIAVAVDGRPSPSPRTVTLKAGEALADVAIDIAPGARVAGKLVGGQLAPGCRVSLAPVPVGNAASVPAFAFDTIMQASPAAMPGKPLAADGSFAFEGQALGHYTLMLQLPSPPRSGGVLALPIDSFRVRAAGVQRDFDMTGDTVRTLRGKLTFPAASTAFEHLVVVATPVLDQAWFHGGFEVAQGLRVFAGRDGAFSLPVLPGSYRLVVVDLTTGATVAMSKPLEVREADVQQDVEVPLVQVTIDLKPASGEAMAMVGRLEVRNVLASQRDSGSVVDPDDGYDMGHGVDVPRGAKSLTLALPHGDVLLFARSSVAALHVGDEEHRNGALGKLELQLPGDKKTAFVLEVAAPSEVKEPEKGENDAKDKR